jgi:hypothetical protein
MHWYSVDPRSKLLEFIREGERRLCIPRSPKLILFIMHELHPFHLLLILDSQRYTKTLESFFTHQKREKTSKSTSRPITTVNSRSPMDMSPQNHFKWCLFLSLLGNQFLSTSSQITQEQRTRLNSRSPLVPVQDASFHTVAESSRTSSNYMDVPKLLSQIVIQNSRLTSGSFCSRLWKPSCDSAPFHTETYGQTERLNQTLEIMLKLYVEDHLNTWTKYLPILEFAYNSATGKSPLSLVYEKTPIHRYHLLVVPLNNKWTLQRPCWSLFMLSGLMQKTACPLHRHNKPNFRMNTGSLVILTLET